MTDNSKAIKIRKISFNSKWWRVQAHFRACAWVLLTLCWQRTDAAQTPQSEPFVPLLLQENAWLEPRDWNCSAKCCLCCQDPSRWLCLGTLSLSLSGLWHTPPCEARVTALTTPPSMCHFHHTGIPSRSTGQLSSSQLVHVALQGSSMAFEQSGGSPCSADSPLPFLIFPVCVPKVK